MTDLEEEFQKLMSDVVDKIQDKKDKGELSLAEAADLILMVQARMKAPGTQEFDQEGWNQSAWCGDNGWQSSKCW